MFSKNLSDSIPDSISGCIVDGKHGTIVPVNRPDSLESAINEIIQKPDQAAARIEDARALVENELSFQKRNQLLEGIYRQLFNGDAAQHDDS